MSVTGRNGTVALLLACLLVLGACTTAPPPDPGPPDPVEPNDELTERSLTQQTGWWWLSAATSDQLDEKIDEGFRLIDIEIVDPSVPTFTAAFVSDAGVHEKDWWWYFGVSAAQVDDAIEQHGARIIDLEPYMVSGTQVFAAILVPNSGDDALTWSWYRNVDTDFLEDAIDEHGHRIVDVELYVLNGEWRASAVLIENTGASQKDWWWYYGVSYDYITEQLDDLDARLVDIELIGPDSFVAVLEERQGKGWWWWLDGTMDTINKLTNEKGARIIDIEQREGASGETRYTAVLLENGGPSGIPVNGTDNPELDPLVNAALDFMRHRCVGAAILGVSFRGQLIGTWGLGRMHGRAANDWDEECGDDLSLPLADPVQSDTPMRIGSISKTITAAMVRWAIKTVAMQELGISLSDDQVERLRLFDPNFYPPLIPDTVDVLYPAPLIPRTLYNTFAGNVPYPVQVGDTGDSTQAALCADLQGFADPQWQGVTLGHVLSHRTGMRRTSPSDTTVVVPNLPVLRNLTTPSSFAAQEQLLRDEFGNAAVDSARAALGLGTGQGYFIPRPTLTETLMVVAGRCLRYPLGDRVYSNTSPAFSVIILQQLMASGRYAAETGRPSTHAGSALDIFFRTELGVSTTGNSGAFLSLTGPNLEGYADREPTKRDWNGTTYYREVWDRKRPHCVMARDGCSFSSWISISPAITNWAWQPERVRMGYDVSGVNPGTGSLAVEAEAMMRFLARYWVNGDGNTDFLDAQIGEERGGDWSQYVFHNGALAGTHAWVLQVGGPDKPTSRSLPPIDEHGRITDDFGNVSPVSLSLPDGLDIFIAINQDDIDRKCSLAEDYTCANAYNRLPAFLYYGASQVDWTKMLPIDGNSAP